MAFSLRTPLSSILSAPVSQLVLASMLLISAVAHGSSVTFTFVDTTFASGATGSGTVVVDTTTGLFGDISFTYDNGSTTDIFDVAPSGQAVYSGTNYYAYYYDPAGDLLLIEVPISSLVGYTGSALCTDTYSCGSSGYETPYGMGGDLFATGSLAVAGTPEPSAFALLGTGVLGLVAMLRKRSTHA